jgi:predicted HTH domain antitoxin
MCVDWLTRIGMHPAHEAGVYPDVETAVQEALHILWQERPNIRIDVAVHRYRKEGLSIARAAASAGVCYDRMKEILAERGVPLCLRSETLEEARAERERQSYSADWRPAFLLSLSHLPMLQVQK